MKPLKYLLGFFAALPIVAIIWFLFPATPLDKAGAKAPELSANKPQGIRPRSSELAPDGSRIKPPTPEEIEALKRFAEAKKRLDEATKIRDEAFKKFADRSTPESRARSADGIMERRDRDYRNLFASWDIDSKIVNDILAIIREREFRMIEDRTVYFQNSGSAKATKEFEFNKEVENSLARMEIINLLGESRAGELFCRGKADARSRIRAGWNKVARARLTNLRGTSQEKFRLICSAHQGNEPWQRTRQHLLRNRRL